MPESNVCHCCISSGASLESIAESNALPAEQWRPFVR